MKSKLLKIKIFLCIAIGSYFTLIYVSPIIKWSVSKSDSIAQIKGIEMIVLYIDKLLAVQILIKWKFLLQIVQEFLILSDLNFADGPTNKYTCMNMENYMTQVVTHISFLYEIKTAVMSHNMCLITFMQFHNIYYKTIYKFLNYNILKVTFLS